jgi:hypothetical protein
LVYALHMHKAQRGQKLSVVREVLTGLQLSVVRKKLNVVADGGRRKLSVVTDGATGKRSAVPNFYPYRTRIGSHNIP